ncbi:hypothetical protein [Nocardia australiensis]|uniref:hypothetical protein n=1 Tax=Nocardia australiensis TaxID=2887191 RepID=UPI001D141956|nr:hypothetical protein [Nocardia australiensis]
MDRGVEVGGIPLCVRRPFEGVVEANVVAGECLSSLNSVLDREVVREDNREDNQEVNVAVGCVGTGALIAARVQRLVIGSWDPYHGAVCSQWDLVRDQRLNHRLEVVYEVLTTKTDDLIGDYLKIEQHLAEQRRIDIRLGL